MKPINEIRGTRKFHVTSHVARDLAAIHKMFGHNLISVAGDEDRPYTYTIRVVEDAGRIVDHRLELDVVTMIPRVVETLVILGHAA